MDTRDDSPLQFPCEYPVKAMGRATPSLELTVWQIVHAHAPNTSEGGVRVSPSRNGRFLSVTVTIVATGRDQLDAIYRDLQAHDDILATL